MNKAYSESRHLLKTGNTELDRKIGGIPIPTLCLIEGENSSGKSVLVQVIAYGALKQKFNVHYITTENTITSLLGQIESLGMDVKPYYISWNFSITSINVAGVKWQELASRQILNLLEKFLIFLHETLRREVIIIDNMTHFVAGAKESQILDFFSFLREFIDKNSIAIFLTLHPYAMHSDLLVRVRSVCDGHFLLQVREMSDQTIRLLRVSKLRGAVKKIDVTVGFTVDPAFGIKVIPISLARG